MTEEKRKEVETELADFVIRISKKEEATPAEMDALARIAAILIEI